MLQHFSDANAITIATTGGIEAIARAMINHADDNAVQEYGAWAIYYVVGGNPVHFAMAGEAGVVPLLQQQAGVGNARAAKQLQRMGM